MTMTGDQAGTRADEGDAAAFDAARRAFAATLGGFRRSPVLVPLDDRGGLWTTSYGGVWWIHAFSDEGSLADFARGRDEHAGRQWDYVTVLGARLLDVVQQQAVLVDEDHTGRVDLQPLVGRARSPMPGNMGDNTVEIQIAEVIDTDPNSAECAVRCLSGTAHPGDVFVISSEYPPEQGVTPMTLEWIECYGFRADCLETACTAKIRLSGTAATVLSEGSRITSPPR